MRGRRSGAAFPPARLEGPRSIGKRIAPVGAPHPDAAARSGYDAYSALSTSTTATVHALAARENRTIRTIRTVTEEPR